MKILYIAHSTAWDGSGKALYNIIDYMARQNHEIYLITPKESGKLIELVAPLGVRIIPINGYRLNIWPRLRNPLKFIKRILGLIYYKRKAIQTIKKVILSLSPDIVHTNVGPLDLALDVCIQLGIPHVWHIREYQDKDFAMKYFPLKKHFVKKVLKNGNYNIAITKDIFDYWQLREDRDIVIYDGVFSAKILPILPQKKENYILFTGRVEPAKGLDIAIEAFALYIDNFKDVDTLLLVAGHQYEGSKYQLYCENLIVKYNLQDRVVFLGNRSDIYDLMSKAKCMIVASRFEGFGFITVEAMLNSCPVIGRMTGGTKEQIEEGYKHQGVPIAYSFNTKEECADMLHIALTNDNKEIVSAAYSRVTASYTNEICGKQIEDYYYSII